MGNGGMTRGNGIVARILHHVTYKVSGRETNLTLPLRVLSRGKREGLGDPK